MRKQGIKNPRQQPVLDEVREEPAYDDARPDLASAVLEAANGLVDRARRQADAEALALADQAVELHDRIGGTAAEAARARSRLPAKLEEARAAVLKARVRREALTAMDAALGAGDPESTYDARNDLIVRYPDQVDDPEVIAEGRPFDAALAKALIAGLAERGHASDGALTDAGRDTAGRLIGARHECLHSLIADWEPEEDERINEAIARLARELAGDVPELSASR